jgi:hypothetical protein
MAWLRYTNSHSNAVMDKHACVASNTSKSTSMNSAPYSKGGNNKLLYKIRQEKWINFHAFI